MTPSERRLLLALCQEAERSYELKARSAPDRSGIDRMLDRAEQFQTLRREVEHEVRAASEPDLALGLRVTREDVIEAVVAVLRENRKELLSETGAAVADRLGLVKREGE